MFKICYEFISVKGGAQNLLENKLVEIFLVPPISFKKPNNSMAPYFWTHKSIPPPSILDFPICPQLYYRKYLFLADIHYFQSRANPNYLKSTGVRSIDLELIYPLLELWGDGDKFLNYNCSHFERQTDKRTYKV